MNNTTIKPWETLTLADDFIFCKVLTNEEVCKTLLEQMLNIKIDHLEYVQSQQTLDLSLDAKGVRFDVYVKGDDKVFDVEMQKISKSDLPKRARYYQDLIDISTIHKGESYHTLKESYIIFICMTDPFGQGRSCYHFENLCIEDNELKLDDRTYKVFYNASSYDKETNPEVKAFLKYLSHGKTETNFTSKLKDLVDEALGNEKWRLNYMTLEMIRQEEKEAGIELGRQQGIEQGLEKGLKAGIQQGFQKLQETARNLKRMNLSVSQISEATGLSVEEIEKL